MGFGHGSDGRRPQRLRAQAVPATRSHGRLLDWLGASAARARSSTSAAPTAASGRSCAAAGHRVHGVDLVKHDGVGERLDSFVEADLNAGLPPEVGHRLRPDRRRRRARARRRPRRAARRPRRHAWRPAARCSCRCPTSATGTRAAAPPSACSTTTPAARSTRATCASSPAAASSAWSRSCGLRIVERDVVGVPVDVLERGGPGGRLADVGRVASRRRAAARPTAGRPCSATSSSTASSRRDGCPHERPARPGRVGRWGACGGALAFFAVLLDLRWSPGRTAIELRYASNFFDLQADAFLRGPPRRAREQPRHRGLRRRRPHLHVLPAVPGTRAHPGACW